MAAQPVRVEPTRVGAPEGAAAGSTNLNQRYTFSNFIVGSANRLAHAASLSVAERPGHAYNPLFLYGGVGLGKTHLMHAIGNAVVAKFPRKRVAYATSEKFTNEFITSIQQGRIDDFRNRYRRIDLLLIDDIQFIADKERTQEEFFHTFNAIHEDGKQIVLSSDRPPKAILTLEERLRSRFEWGLIADLTAPDLETRIAILRAKAEEQGTPITSDVIEFIARKIVSNIRELEGALNRIVAYASMGAMPISIELAQAVLSNVLYNPKKRQVTPERIAQAVSDYYGVGMDAAQGPEAREVDRRAAPDRDVPDARGDGRLAAPDRRGAGRPGPLHGPPRLRQDQPRDAGQRRDAARGRGGPGADLLRLAQAGADAGPERVPGRRWRDPAHRMRQISGPTDRSEAGPGCRAVAASLTRGLRWARVPRRRRLWARIATHAWAVAVGPERTRGGRSCAVQRGSEHASDCDVERRPRPGVPHAGPGRGAAPASRLGGHPAGDSPAEPEASKRPGSHGRSATWRGHAPPNPVDNRRPAWTRARPTGDATVGHRPSGPSAVDTTGAPVRSSTDTTPRHPRSGRRRPRPPAPAHSAVAARPSVTVHRFHGNMTVMTE